MRLPMGRAPKNTGIWAKTSMCLCAWEGRRLHGDIKGDADLELADDGDLAEPLVAVWIIARLSVRLCTMGDCESGVMPRGQSSRTSSNPPDYKALQTARGGVSP